MEITQGMMRGRQVAARETIAREAAARDAVTEGFERLLGKLRLAEKPLTARQLEIARGLTAGDSVGDLARRLGVTEQCVRRHLSQLYQQTGARSQAGLAGWCVAHGIVTVPELQKVYCCGEPDPWSEW